MWISSAFGVWSSVLLELCHHRWLHGDFFCIAAEVKASPVKDGAVRRDSAAAYFAEDFRKAGSDELGMITHQVLRTAVYEFLSDVVAFTMKVFKARCGKCHLLPFVLLLPLPLQSHHPQVLRTNTSERL